jgi:phosphoserine aminotransferase
MTPKAITHRVYNFSAGPAVLPLPVLERARDEMLALGDCGMSVMELSHRSPQFDRVLHEAESGLRDLLRVPENYRILFMQGGASLQFSIVPMTFLGPGLTADYVVTGAWGEKAIAEARKVGKVNVAFTDLDNGFRDVPPPENLNFTPDAAYVHYVSNETIHGVEFKYELEAGGIPIICDASSNILSKPFDVEKYAVIYAGAQKNIGPSGVCVVIIRDDLIERVPKGLHSMLDYRNFAVNASMPNTPNTWGIYIISLVCDWLKEQGGVDAIRIRNEQKAAILYKAIDNSDGFYRGHAERGARSLMNVTFRLADDELTDRFCSESESAGFDGLRGHRTVGGIRASIYNAFPIEGAEALADFMRTFAQHHG